MTAAEDAETSIPALHGEVIQAETLWSCTTCSACDNVCPLGVSPLGMIGEMRRNLVGEGQLRGSPAAMGYMVAGDVITHVDGEAVPSTGAGLVTALTPKRGQRVTFTVLRDGDPQDKEVALYP